MRSRIYRDLTTKKVDEVTIDELDTYRREFYAQGRKNKLDYDDLNVIALTSNQNAVRGNVPGTSDINTATGIYDSKTNIFQPTSGTWSLQYISFFESGGSGTYTHEVYLEVKGGSVQIISTSDYYIKLDVEIDSNVILQARTVGGSGSPTTAGATAYYMRCR